MPQNDTAGFSSYSEGYQYYAKEFKPWCTSNGLQLRFTLHNHELAIRLKMPVITPKYWSAIQKLSEKSATSLVFYHLAAARNGQQVFYNELKSLGYAWKNNKWVHIKKKAKLPK